MESCRWWWWTRATRRRPCLMQTQTKERADEGREQFVQYFFRYFFQSCPRRAAHPERGRGRRSRAADGGRGRRRPELAVRHLPAGRDRHHRALHEDRLPAAAEPARAGGEHRPPARGDRDDAGG